MLKTSASVESIQRRIRFEVGQIGTVERNGEENLVAYLQVISQPSTEKKKKKTKGKIKSHSQQLMSQSEHCTT
jgi:N-acyl-L-homoserine lactone synthetase